MKLRNLISMFKVVVLHYFKNKIHYRTKPRVLQLPITGKCNSRCVICNVWKNKKPVDLDTVEFKKVIKHPYFNKIEHVGINGGEPSLHHDYKEIIDAILNLPKIKAIYLISNALSLKKISEILIYSKEKCSAKGVIFNLTVSIDGIGQTHNVSRGIPTAFEKTTNTLKEIIKDKNKYCNHIDIGCTISKYNVYHLAEFDSYFSEYDIPVFYHLAVPNKRIGTFTDSDYSVLSDNRAKLMAEEFFLTQFFFEKNKSKKIRYFMNYFYLKNGGKNRLAICNYLYRDVTIDENLNVYLCATASDCIGNLKESNFNSLIAHGKVKNIEKRTAVHCDTCIHYTDTLSLKGVFELLKYVAVNKIKWNITFKYLR